MADRHDDLDPDSVPHNVVPTDFSQSRLRACMSCSLIKTVNQFQTNGCENCPFLNLAGDRERISACCTNQFIGSYVVMSPKRSWVAKWQRVATFTPGAYAISIDAVMPQDIIDELEENRQYIHSVLATAEKTEET